MHHRLHVVAAISLMVATALSAAPSLDVRLTATPPKIDGVLSPGEWDGAAHSDAFRTVEPVENGEPTERTEFWVTYDPDTLYVAIHCHDTAGAAGIRAYSMQRDQDNGSDDIVRIVLDTFHRQSDGYYFALTAAGGKHDGLIQDKEQANSQWDAIWLGRTTIDAGGWSAEFAIPVKSLSFDPANSTWGFNVARAVRRKQEVMRWTGIFRNRPTIALPLLGDLRGLGYDLQVSREALEFLVREGFHPLLGARPLRKTVERQLQDAVVRELFRCGGAGGELVMDPGARRLVIVPRWGMYGTYIIRMAQFGGFSCLY